VDRISVDEGSTYNNYRSNGRDIRIRFQGFIGSAPAISIPGNTATITGGSGSFSFPSTFSVPVSTNILYEPIPFELLYTAETLPSISLSVNGLPAACPGFNCNYDYTVSASAITSYTLSAGTLTIIGTGLPTTTLSDIMFSNTLCTSPSTTTSQITCTIAAVAGTSW
jgi:hypothetical protein